MPRIRRALPLLRAQGLALAPPLRAAKEDPAAQLRAAQARLDQEDPQGALDILDKLVKKQPKLAPGYLMRATARLMLGAPGGKEDLDRALQLDPTLRQAWLDRGAVALSEKRYDAALADFEKARELQPGDANILLIFVAVQRLLGYVDAASKSFESFLGLRPGDAQATYLVARNYALAGYAGLAIQYLQGAVALDERMRAAARADANFGDLASNARFQQLLAADSYMPPAYAYRAVRSFPGAYSGGRGPLLPATLDALQALGEPYEPRGEVTPDWALLWGAMRVKVSDGPQGGTVELSAPPDRMSAADWQRRSDRLLDSIFVQLAKRSRGPKPKPPG
jgi:tetratricopeptide (TPR) repeat protein